MGIEPTYPAWKAGVLPLNYTRIFHIYFVYRFNVDYLTTAFSICQLFFYFFVYFIFFVFSIFLFFYFSLSCLLFLCLLAL